MPKKPPPDVTKSNPVATAFGKALDRHGFPFQYAVLEKARELSYARRSYWLFHASEFPTEVQAAPTHVDFLLKRGGNNLILVCECKRANPALANWCFAKIPYVRRNGHTPSIIIERVANATPVEDLVTSPQVWEYVDHVYQLGLEVRTQHKGDDTGSGRGALQEALAQVFRGLNGIVELLRDHRHLVLADNPWLLAPVIFTTAKLWTSDVKLQESDLHTGTLKEQPGLTQVPWLVYDYHLSLGLKHTAHQITKSDDLSALLYNEFIRSVIIVGVDGIEPFLVWSSQI